MERFNKFAFEKAPIALNEPVATFKELFDNRVAFLKTQYDDADAYYAWMKKNWNIPRQMLFGWYQDRNFRHRTDFRTSEDYTKSLSDYRIMLSPNGSHPYALVGIQGYARKMTLPKTDVQLDRQLAFSGISNFWESLGSYHHLSGWAMPYDTSQRSHSVTIDVNNLEAANELLKHNAVTVIINRTTPKNPLHQKAPLLRVSKDTIEIYAFADYVDKSQLVSVSDGTHWDSFFSDDFDPRSHNYGLRDNQLPLGDVGLALTPREQTQRYIDKNKDAWEWYYDNAIVHWRFRHGIPPQCANASDLTFNPGDTVEEFMENLRLGKFLQLKDGNCFLDPPPGSTDKAEAHYIDSYKRNHEYFEGSLPDLSLDDGVFPGYRRMRQARLSNTRSRKASLAPCVNEHSLLSMEPFPEDVDGGMRRGDLVQLSDNYCYDYNDAVYTLKERRNKWTNQQLLPHDRDLLAYYKKAKDGEAVRVSKHVDGDVMITRKPPKWYSKKRFPRGTKFSGRPSQLAGYTEYEYTTPQGDYGGFAIPNNDNPHYYVDY